MGRRIVAAHRPEACITPSPGRLGANDPQLAPLSSPEVHMDIGIIGSGQVAQTLGGRFLDLGHSVTISSRDPSQPKDRGEWGVIPSADEWVAAQRAEGADAAAGSFAAAALAGDLIVNATAGASSLAALELAGVEHLAGKIDIANPLDFSRGMPPSLTVCNTDSLGEQIKAAFPKTKVVKTLNTVNVGVMIDPAQLGAETDLFIAGNDAEAKARVTKHVLREWLGWSRVLDLGDITAARATEMYMPLWLRLWGAAGTGALNIKVVAAQS